MAKIEIGQKMPNFKFNTGYRNDLYVKDILKGKTVFWVLRYIGCTVCRFDVHCIQQRYDEFKAKGAQVFVVMQSDQAHIQADLKDIDLPFEIITDPEMKIYNELSIEAADSMEALVGDRLADLQEKGGKAGALGFKHGDYEGNEQQLPAMFIVEEDGTVSYVHYAKNIMDMPSVDEVLSML